MTISKSIISKAAILSIMGVLAMAASQVQAVEIAAPGLQGSVKTTMQAELGAGSTSAGVNANANVNANADGRVYKGDTGTSTATSTDDKDTKVKGNDKVDVSSDIDFAAVVQSDDKVKKVESDDDSVSVWYKVPAKLFGFIPMGMVVRTTVGSAGEVEVSHPWYSFLASAQDDGIEEAIQAEIDIAVGTSTATTTGEVKLTGAKKSAFVKAVHDILKNAFKADVSAEAEVEASN